MSFFRERLEAFPRLADYRLAKAAGYWPYYKTVESASRPRFRIEGQDYINFGSKRRFSTISGDLPFRLCFAEYVNQMPRRW